MDKVRRGIQENNAFYHFIVECAEQAYARDNMPDCLHFCQEAASYATFYYCGFYAEPRLEQLLTRVRAKAAIGPLPAAARPTSGRLRVLHYATSIFEVGGHTRLIENWIRSDAANRHDVLLTRQTVPVPGFITEAVAAVQGTVTVADAADDLHNARQLAAITGNYDILVLHHHANDLVPMLALAEAGRAIPVCVLNHGDHRFWLGVTVCDLLVEIRDNLNEADRQRRGIREFGLLPNPVAAAEVLPQARQASRAVLGLRPDKVLLLSIGASYKYEPIDEKNFFADVLPVLDQHAQAVGIIVGIDPASELATRYAHPRLRFVAPTMHLADFHNACDIYLEGYPFSSFTAYLEVGAKGKPICRMYDPPLLNEYRLSTYPVPVRYPANRSEWMSDLQRLITDAQARVAAGQQEYANSRRHAPAAIHEYVQAIYGRAAAVGGQAVQNRPPVALLYGPNDRYLFKMQHNSVNRILLGPFYRLSLRWKLRLLRLTLRTLVSEQRTSLRDLLWFVFKAR